MTAGVPDVTDLSRTINRQVHEQHAFLTNCQSLGCVSVSRSNRRIITLHAIYSVNFNSLFDVHDGHLYFNSCVNSKSLHVMLPDLKRSIDELRRRQDVTSASLLKSPRSAQVCSTFRC
jgi:hypothetical protein